MLGILHHIQLLLLVPPKEQALTDQQIRIHHLGRNGTILTRIATGGLGSPTLRLGTPDESKRVKEVDAFLGEGRGILIPGNSLVENPSS